MIGSRGGKPAPGKARCVLIPAYSVSNVHGRPAWWLIRSNPASSGAIGRGASVLRLVSNQRKPLS